MAALRDASPEIGRTPPAAGRTAPSSLRVLLSRRRK
jgi:hypothetical protein